MSKRSDNSYGGGCGGFELVHDEIPFNREPETPKLGFPSQRHIFYVVDDQGQRLKYNNQDIVVAVVAYESHNDEQWLVCGLPLASAWAKVFKKNLHVVSREPFDTSILQGGDLVYLNGCALPEPFISGDQKLYEDIYRLGTFVTKVMRKPPPKPPEYEEIYERH